MLPRALLLLAISMLLTACPPFAANFEKPVLSFVSITLDGGNLLQQNFRVLMRIHNPNRRALPIKGLSADLRLSGEEVASGAVDRPFVVSASGDTDIELTIKANMALALLTLSQHPESRGDGISYELTGEAAVDLPFFRTMAFHQSGTLSL